MFELYSETLVSCHLISWISCPSVYTLCLHQPFLQLSFPLPGASVLPSVSCCCSVTKLCPTLWDPMDCSTPGFPVLHHLPEIMQTHVHWVSDAIQPSRPLLSHSPAFSLCQRQGLFQLVGSIAASASVLPMNIQCWVPLGLTGLISLLSKGLSRIFSSTTTWK